MTAIGQAPVPRRSRLEVELTRHRDGLRVDLVDPNPARLVNTVASLPLDEAMRVAARMRAAVRDASAGQPPPWPMLEAEPEVWWLSTTVPLRMRAERLVPLYGPNGIAQWVAVDGERIGAHGRREWDRVALPADALPRWARPLVCLNRADAPKVGR